MHGHTYLRQEMPLGRSLLKMNGGYDYQNHSLMDTLIQEIQTQKYDPIHANYSRVASSTFILAYLFNTVLIWLITTKTPAPMLVYSKLLLAPCFMDLVIALCTFLIQPISIVDHGYFGIVQNGFFRSMPQVYNYTANVLWLQMLLLFVCCTTIQFIFRYYMISSDGQIPAKLKYMTGLVLVILLIAHVFLHYVSDYPFDYKMPDMVKLAKLVEEEVGLTEIRFASFTWARAPVWIFHCCVMVALFGTCYGIIAFCTIGTRHYITKTSELTVQEGCGDRGKKNRMKEYNQQVTRALLIQAILPTMDVIELAIQTISPIFFPAHLCTIKYMIYSAVPLYFIPVLNPLATIILVKPYRKAFMKVCRIEQGSRVESSTVNGGGKFRTMAATTL